MNEMHQESMDISIVIPFFNEEDALPPLFQELEKLLSESLNRNRRIELIFVDDGSEDRSLELVQSRFQGKTSL